MVLATRRTMETMHDYTVEEVARFLQYDRESVRYWLRTGHLAGRFDARIDDWRVTPRDLVTFLRQSSEPMPTGIITQVQVAENVPAAAPAATITPAPSTPTGTREPVLAGSGVA